MKVFMDDFSAYRGTSDLCLAKILYRYEGVNLILNWRKLYFIVQEGIVLGHVIYQRCIQVDSVKIEVIK